MTVILNAKLCGTSAENAVYVGRPSKWGNPFTIGRDGNRTEVIAKYEEWIVEQPELMAAIRTLRGKNLICWCAPQRCHAEILMRIANRPLTRNGWWVIGSDQSRRGVRVEKGMVVCGREKGLRWEWVAVILRDKRIPYERHDDWVRYPPVRAKLRRRTHPR